MNSREDIVVWSYWRAVVRYGYVGKGKEISVARYLGHAWRFDDD
jgi:hypothetical protein